MFKGMSLPEFNDTFKNEDDCRQYLFDLKWGSGFSCRRCGNSNFWKGRTRFHARCISCDYDESTTAHTVFHKLQIPMLKAFSMAFQIVLYKNGISTIDLAKLFEIDEKTAARFRLKAQDAMLDWIAEEAGAKVNEMNRKVDGIILTHRSKELNGLQRINLILEQYESRNRGIKIIRYKPGVPFPDKLDSCHLVAGKYVDEGKDLKIWNLRKWLEGTHHHCSAKRFPGYVGEYLFRFNNRHRQEDIWHLLMQAMLTRKPTYISLTGRDGRIEHEKSAEGGGKN